MRLFILKQLVIVGLTINYRLFMHNRWDQKLNQHNLGLFPHGKKDGPRLAPKNVADPFDANVQQNHPSGQFFKFGFSVNSKEIFEQMVLTHLKLGYPS